MDLSKIKKIHIIGIEGAGTSALAVMLAQEGFEVSGTDEGDHFYFDVLQQAGIQVRHQFAAENIPIDADVVICSTAYNPQKNPELAQAVNSKAKVLTYPQALGEVFNTKFGIAVCGSHGKTTTTAWLAWVLLQAGLNPSAIIGSKAPQLGGGTLTGKSSYLIIEADEYQNKFQYYQPKAILLNNVDYDHPDFFPTRADYEEVFIEFIKKIPKKGFLVANFDDPIISSVANVNCLGRVISYALDNEAEYVAYDLQVLGMKQYFKVKTSEGDLGSFSIQLMGRHNVYNALAVIATSLELEVPLLEIRTHLETFEGTSKRMEKMGEYQGAIFINDYAHHPTEIKATISGLLQAYPDKKLRVVFQPHTFTRTLALLDDFATSFAGVDEVIILDIFGSAREQQGTIHALDLVLKIKKNNVNVKHIPTLDEAREYLSQNIQSKEVVVFMGAGDAFKIGEKLLGE